MSAARPILYLDPGHGGPDPGNVNRGLREADSAMLICERIAHYVLLLSKQGDIRSEARVSVVLSRGHTNGPSISTRTFRARQLKADLLLSVHTNSVVSPLAHGAEAWVSAEGSYRQRSTEIANAMLKALEKLGSRNRGAKLDTATRHKRLGIVREVCWHMPALVIEPAFASHPTERGKLLDPRWRETLSLRLAECIVTELGVIKPRLDLLK